jgi:hypothetical protein
VQVDPIKPASKAPGTKRLKPKYDDPLSNFAFKFNLRRYNEERLQKALNYFINQAVSAAFYTWRENAEYCAEVRVKAGRCTVKPVLKAPGFCA